MTSRSRTLVFTILAAAALPSSASAQEPQPWTNTSAIGSRVVPALPVREVEATVVRADGGGGSTGSFNLSENRNDPGGGPSTKASFVGGRSGISYGWKSYDVFLTSYAYRVTIPKLARNAGAGPLAVNPYTQSGDVALGARWLTTLGADLHAGLEGGAVFLGRTGPAGDTGIPLEGPNTSATSPFVRGLFTWQGLRDGSAEPPLTVSANLGVFADQSWNVWKEAAKNQDGAEDEPLEEERIAMSFYGDKRTATRLLFGTSVAYRIGEFARPYLELTGESTSPDLTMRLTPGLAIHPLGPRPLALFVSADLDLSGDLKVSPRAPAVRANAGLQFAFGARSGRDPRAAPSPTPVNNRNAFRLSVRVVDEMKQPIPGARVRITAPDGSELGEGVTKGEGAVLVVLPQGSQNSNLTIHAKHADFMEWQPITHPGRATPAPVVTLYRQRTLLNFQFVNNGKEWPAPPPPNVRVLVTPTEPQRTGREFLGPVEIPSAEGFRKLTIAVSVLDYTRALGAVNELQPGTRTLVVYVDPERKCADFNPEKCAPVVVPTPGGIDRFGFNIFEGDSVDVKAEEAAKLLVKLQPITNTKPPQAHRVIVQARKGDPLFQAAMAQARRDALLTWLHTQKIPPGTVKVETNHEATSDTVILEVPK